MQEPWDQQPKESSRAFAAFVVYRDMGHKRSCNAVAQQLKLNHSTVLEFSKRHNWQERVRAWDTQVDKENQQRQIEAIKIMKERQIAIALNAQDAADIGIKRLIKQLTAPKGQTLSPYSMKPDALARLLDIGSRLERLNRDVPEQNIEVLDQNFDNLSLEEKQTYRALLMKMQGAS
jgi:hypothetical protein